MRSLTLPSCTSRVTVLHHANATTLVDVTSLVAGLQLAAPAHLPEFLDEFADLRRQMVPEKRPIFCFEPHALGKDAKFYPLDVLREIIGMV